MPKVMMIGKVSKLKSRTRRAGSFKGSLGTVVLEGSRAKSRRYGMGNIAGTWQEHKKEMHTYLNEFIMEFNRAQEAKTCASRIEHAANALHAYGKARAIVPHAVEPGKQYAGTGISGPQAMRMNSMLRDMMRSCARPDSSGVSGARRRRRSR